MTKKQTLEATGDSDELQALFDSIASGNDTPPPAAEPVAAAASAAAPSSIGEVGDNDELQALFDSVAEEFAEPGSPPEPHAETGTVTESVVEQNSDSAIAHNDGVYNRIGQMTRQVHNTLRALGADDALQDAVHAIPDARQRLSYIAQMTEQAASRVLNATDIAQPLQNQIQSGSEALQAKWDKLFANELSVTEFKELAAETRSFLVQTTQDSKEINSQLMDIMMAQDFQDLTGQVIKKVVELAQALETELLQILIEITPQEKRGAKAEGLMNGPVINAQDRDDVVSTQEQVDDLLDSLGF